MSTEKRLKNVGPSDLIDPVISEEPHNLLSQLSLLEMVTAGLCENRRGERFIGEMMCGRRKCLTMGSL